MAFSISNVNWVSKDFLEDAPDEVLTVLTAMGPVASAVNSFIALGSTSLALVPPPIPIPVIDPLFILINQLIAQVEDLINSVRETGASLLIVPPGVGGVQRIEQQFRLALLNEADGSRPTFGLPATRQGTAPTSFVGVLGAFINGPDFKDIQEGFDLLNNVFAFIDKVKSISLNVFEVIKDDPSRALDFFFPNYQNQVNAGTARPIGVPRWITIRLVDLIPGADDALSEATDYLNGVSDWVPKSAATEFLDFLSRQIARATAFVDSINSSINQINGAFVGLPAQVFIVTPFEGSTLDLAAAASDIFNPAKNTGLQAVSAQSYTAGVLCVFGGPSASIVSTSQDLFNDFIFGVENPLG